MPSQRSRSARRVSPGREAASKHLADFRGGRAVRPMSIKIGCAWESSSHAVPTALRDSINRSAEAARSRLPKRGSRHDGEGAIADVRALRGSAGRTVLDAVMDDIRMADLLVFDITPARGSKHGVANVILELGIAIGMGKPVILCRQGRFDPRAVCSDILGLYVSSMDDGSLDRSAQMAVMNAVVGHFAKVGRTSAGRWTRDHSGGTQWRKEIRS